MKFLLDMPVSPRVAAWLGERGHDAVHAFSLGLARASDRELLSRAATEARILITMDTDFPQLLALSREVTAGVILLRGGDYTVEETEDLVARVLALVSEETLARSLCVVDRHRVRHRLLPLR